MAYRKGHVTGHKKERKGRQNEQARLEAMGRAITAQWAGKSVAEMAALILQQSR